MNFTKEDIFIGVLALAAGAGVWAVFEIIWGLVRPEKRTVHRRLGLLKGQDPAQLPESLLLREQKAPTIGWEDFPIIGPFCGRVVTVMPEIGPGRFLVAIILATALSAVLSVMLRMSIASTLIVAGVVFCIPLIIVNVRFHQRQKVLTEQLVEALDFLARALRAGHSLSNGLQMLAEEIPEPIAAEFRRVHEQHNLGQTLEAGLTDMATRIRLPDFAFFVTSIMIQRQTGGDLAEVLDKINEMVRSRIRLKQHVHALTAEGRATGWVLLALPIFTLLALWWLNPEYTSLLFEHKIGQLMFVGSLVLQVAGFLLIRRIVNIEP